MSRDWPTTRRMTRALLHAPELFAGDRIVRVVSFSAAADQDWFSLKHRDVRRGKGLSPIALLLGFSVFVEILEIDGTLGAPDGLASVLVQGDDELMITAIKIHNQ